MHQPARGQHRMSPKDVPALGWLSLVEMGQHEEMLVAAGPRVDGAVVDASIGGIPEKGAIWGDRCVCQGIRIRVGSYEQHPGNSNHPHCVSCKLILFLYCSSRVATSFKYC